MNFSTVLCLLFSRLNGEKTVNASYHLLRGKRSGQTIQDAKYYHIQNYFGILPKLSKSLFDQAVEHLQEQNYIVIDENSRVFVTEEGETLIESTRPFDFDGWHYRGREEIFFARLSLTIQTLSHFRVSKKQFLPIQRDPEVQRFVKMALRNAPIEDPSFAIQIKEELVHLFEESRMEEIQKMIITYRFVGYGQTGWTWQQLGEKLNLLPIDVKLHYIESLHKMLKVIEKSEKTIFLSKIAANIKVETVLTDSTKRTKGLFDQGHSLEEIANRRQLKISTIEDHIVEMALNDSDFPIERFVAKQAYREVRKKSEILQTKRLRLLKEQFPALTYFQLRLILSLPAKEEEVNESPTSIKK